MIATIADLVPHGIFGLLVIIRARATVQREAFAPPTASKPGFRRLENANLVQEPRAAAAMGWLRPRQRRRGLCFAVELFDRVDHSNNVLDGHAVLHVVDGIEDVAAVPAKDLTTLQDLLSDLLRGAKG